MKKFILTLLPLLFMVSCTKETKKEEDKNLNFKIYGNWKIAKTAYSNLSSYKFLTLSNTKVSSIYIDNSGFRNITSSSFVPYADQVLIDVFGNGFPNVYNYKISNDSLILSNGDDMVLTAVNANPSEFANWAAKVKRTDQILNLFPVTLNNISGIGFDGTNLLVPDYQGGLLYFVNPFNKNISSSNASASAMNTIEFDGTDYWTCRNGFSTLDKIKKNGTVLFNSVALGPWISGIAYLSNTQIVAYSNNENTFYMYNPTTNTIAFQKEIKNLSLRDMATYNGKIYVVSNSFVYRMDPAGFVVEKTYILEGINDASGIASVGGDNFWITQGTDLFKFNLPL